MPAPLILSADQLKQIESLRNKRFSYPQIAEHMGLKRSTVGRVCTGKFQARCHCPRPPRKPKPPRWPVTPKREGVCCICGAGFLAPGASRKATCSAPCSKARAKKERRAYALRERKADPEGVRAYSRMRNKMKRDERRGDAIVTGP